MHSRRLFWVLLGVLLLAGAWFFWPHGGRRAAEQNSAVLQKIVAQKKSAPQPSFTTKSASTAPQFLTGNISTNAISSAAKTNQFPYRLANTKKSIGELAGDRHAILLENALIDTGAKLDLNIPKNLQAQGDPGAYIVQARGPIDAAFRAQLAAAGAQIVSYIPNDAYLVRVPSGGANELAALPLTQSVVPYEPYYKLTASLLDAIAKSEPVSELKVAAYPDTADQAKAMIEKAGMTISATEPSPFGQVFTVQNVSDVAAVAQMSAVQLVEPVRQRIHANDLSRPATGVSLDSVTTTNYLNLGGSNVIVEVDDSGIDATHPDFDNGGGGPVRVFSDDPANLVDTDGHGTFVAGEIAGDGFESMTVTNAQGSINPGTNGQYRGKAPLANLFSMNFEDPDQELQAAAALTNALISNNSWNVVGDDAYDLEAASYDAAVRDSLPLVTGSQPVLFVFSAGNDGGGDDNGGGGSADTILSPATAKNVITVGALQQDRNITNTYTPLGTTNQVAFWQAGTQNGQLVAGYSSRGNVGIGTEGPNGRFKPDVVAPGSFVVSTRSQEWDEGAYYNPTNFFFESFDDQFVGANSQNNYNLSLNFVPPNTTFNSNVVGVTIRILHNLDSPVPFPILPIYVSHINFPDPANPATFDFPPSTNNQVSIPNPDGGNAYLAEIQNGNLFYTIVNTNSERVGFDLVEEIIVTNQNGNLLTVLSNLNNSLGGSPDSTVPPHYYRYESGTSMAAADTSGVLALMQDYFTNTLHMTPSPALMKALLISGARTTGSYNFNIATTDVNFEGWGLINLPNSLPPGITNVINASCSSFFVDQSPTNALATGDSQTFSVKINSASLATDLPLAVTLAWTDPPGNPAAAIKLVNNLDVVVTNIDTGDVYFGNDIAPNSQFNAPWDTNTTPNLDTINNVENIIIPNPLGTNYSVTIIGRNVNVNAVTAQSNNVVQDYALMIACGEGEVTNAITVTPAAPALASNSTGDQQITFVGISTNGMATNNLTFGGVFLNQLAGANTPLLGTNTVDAISNFTGNAIVTLGMTNQWHFYVVPNATTFSNAAFVTFLPDTLATPRMGVFADSDANSTQPEADIDMYVSTSPSLTNLDPMVISNCVNGTQVGASGVNGFNGASLSRGGTEFVVDTNSSVSEVYYVGVKSETAEAAQYGFLPVFSQQPFSQNQNGNELVNGLLLPTAIPDGTPAHPGTAYIFALAVQPITVQDVIVSDQIVHQNFGDLTGTLNHDGTPVVLNNHDSLGNPPGPYDFIYDDSPQPAAGSQPPDGPGTLQTFQGQQGIGPWILTEVDNSLTQTGAVTGFSLLITPHQDLAQGVNVLLAGFGITNFFIDVPVGVTNLTFFVTNTVPPAADPSNPGQLFEKFGALPAPQQPPLLLPTNFDQMVTITNNNPLPPNFLWGSISVGQTNSPPIQPGRYFVTLYNPSPNPQDFFIKATLGVGQIAPVDFSSGGPVPLLDDAVTYAFITNNFVPGGTNETIAAINVGIRVDHPRISDLVFHLISPDGTRFLLMENRGGTSTNGAGVTIFTTNAVQSVASGNNASNTNVINVGETSGTLPISYNFFTVPDQMTVYYGTNLVPANLIYNSGSVSGSNNITVSFPPASPTDISSNLTIVMNQFGNTNTSGDLWNYTAGGVTTNYFYLVFTEDTNLTTIPIKFAPPPFVPTNFFSTNFVLSDFETAPAQDDSSTVNDKSTWTVLANQVTVIKDPTNALAGSQFLALANGTISNSIPTVPGATYTLSFAYRGPGIVSLWRGENNVADSINTNNGTLTSGGTYGAGEVGSAFILNGSSGYVQVPASSSLNVGLGAGFTLEGWINPNDLINQMPLFEWQYDGQTGAHFWVSAGAPGCLYANLVDSSGNSHIFATASGILTASWQDVALTYNKNTGNAIIYRNGLVMANVNLGIFTAETVTNFLLGERIFPVGTSQVTYNGGLDEMSIYQRVLSASEIAAIFQKGSAGKFDAAAAFPQNLAKATVNLSGNSTTLFGNNTAWQSHTITFTATGTTTPLVISGVEPGMLLDSFTVSGTGGGANLYYLPEESLDPLIGTSAYGLWQLEIQDDRVGATNNVILDSWQLQFVFANTNPIPSVNIPTPINLPGGIPLTNVVPANSISWFIVTVPPNADIATNDLIFATAPVNLLFNQTTPDTNGDFTLLANQLNGISILTTSSAPTNIVPGSTYFLGVQNTNNFAVTNAIEVDFHLITASPPFAFTEPAQAVTGTNAQLNGMATPNGLPATAWFQWGTNAAYGNQTPPVSVGNSFNVVYVTNSISLTPNVSYHFRLVVSNAFAVVTGFDQILDEANVVTWGANFAGQLQMPPGLSNVVAIAGAYDHSLALKNDETVAVWGDNTFGQTNVPATLNNNLVAVAGGESYSLALKNSGTVIAWGANIFPGETNVPAGLNNVATIASGQYSSMALQNNGTVVAWGANISGLTNVPASLINNVVAIAGGSFHNLAIKNDGTVVAWGDDSIGQTNVPVGLTNVVAISGGSFHSLALKKDGTVVAWGDDSAGQTNVPVGLSNVVAVAAGGFHSLALKNDGSIVGWGDDSAGQLTAPSGLTNFVAIAAGNLHSLALTPQSILNLTNIVLNFTNGVPQTNNILPGAITYFQVSVPTNADFATNLLLFASAPLNILFTTNAPPATNGAAVLIANMTNGVSVLSTTSFPTNITPGAVYYLGVQNTNATTVNYAIEVDFHLVTAPPVSISSIIHTSINGTNGFLLTWLAPSNDLFQVQWNDNLGSTNWTTFTNPPVISYNTNFSATASSATFTFFDDGSQTGGLPPIRFYRLILLSSTNLAQANAIVISHVFMMTNGLDLTWSAPTNDQFEVQWATNLSPPVVWMLFPGTNTSTTGTFTFLDTNAPMMMKFYELILLP